MTGPATSRRLWGAALTTAALLALAALVAIELGAGAPGREDAARLVPPAPVFKGASHAATRRPARSLRIPVPEGVATGDVMVAGVSVRASSSRDVGHRPGWTVVRADRGGPRDRLTQLVYVKVAGSSEPSSYAWSFAASADASGGIVMYRGVDAARPVDAHSGRSGAAMRRGGGAWGVSAPSLRTTAANAVVVGFFASGGRVQAAPPGGARERYEASSGDRAGRMSTSAATDFVQRAAGATGSRVATVRPAAGCAAPSRSAAACRSSRQTIGQLVALRPATPAGGQPASRPGARASALPAGLAGALPATLPASRGATLYVSPSGSDAGPGTLDRPWRTIQKALDMLQPGQRALVRAGTYVEDLAMERAGTAPAPITVEAHPGERPVLQSAGGHPLEVASSAAYFRFRGFVVERYPGTSGGNIDVYGHHVEISRNEIRAGTDQGLYTAEESHDVQVLGNWIHHNGEGIAHQSHGVYLQGDDHLVAGNLIHDHPEGFGIQVYDRGSRAIVVNNTVLASGHSGIVVGGGGGVDHVTIRNNILAFNDKWGIQRDSDCPTDSVADHNVLFGNDYGPVEGGCPGLDVSGGNLTGDPRFVDVGSRNLHLRPGSSALDRALARWAPPADDDGERRPRGAAPDVGAYEDG